MSELGNFLHGLPKEVALQHVPAHQHVHGAARTSVQRQDSQACLSRADPDELEVLINRWLEQEIGFPMIASQVTQIFRLDDQPDPVPAESEPHSQRDGEES